MGFHFSFDKFKNSIQKGPEGQYSRQEALQPLADLVEKFAPQAARDAASTDPKWGAFLGAVKGDLGNVIDDIGRETFAGRLADSYEKFLDSEKGLEDKQDQKAYILAVAKALSERN